MMSSLTIPPNEVLRAPGAAAALASAARRKDDSAVVPVLTLILWLGCLAVGIAGVLVPYARPLPPKPAPPPIVAKLLNVELTTDPLPPVSQPPKLPDLMQPPPVAPPPVVPPPPSMAVAAPSPNIAFAVPIAEPARVVPAAEASYRTVEKPKVAPAPAPVVAQPLTFGHGEGRQPAPEYPRQAERQGQEGVVTVRMTVGEDGRVLAAEAVSPSPWPLLNQAALRVVKSRWRFVPGTLRAYEVAIRFQLKK
jgi:protein TonB